MRTVFFSLKFILLFTLFISAANAQVPNNSFESWAGDTPNEWFPGNGNGYVFVSRSDEAYTGSSSARVEAKSVMGILVPGVLNSGANGDGFPVSQRHEVLTLHYKFKPALNTSYLFVSVGLKKNGEGIGAQVTAIYNETNGFETLNLPVFYITSDVPDTAVVTIIVSDQALDPSANGSYALIDDVSFTTLTDVNDEAGRINNFNLEQNFPNPFNPVTKINYTVPAAGGQNLVSLKVFDILGNEVATLVNESKPAGIYTAEFNAANLPSGIYLYRLQAGSLVETRKMTLLK